MNLSPWKIFVMFVAAFDSRTPFQIELSIRQVPWSWAKSFSAGPVAAFVACGREQALVLSTAMKTATAGYHFMTLPRNKEKDLPGTSGDHGYFRFSSGMGMRTHRSSP